ncbi:MAG TPA: DRTGG domain-containing protein [Thermoanaerobaculaceae bacterium]|nr:DRTGG domain-containing protein [Thermoanaerobaculaceae bacterium]
MQLRSVASLLDCEVVCCHEMLDLQVFSCFAADLMSDVLAFSLPNALLITGLTSVQAVHTADVADCKGILFVCDKRPSPEALELARNREIPLLATRRTTFECCGILFQRGLTAATRAAAEAPCSAK